MTKGERDQIFNHLSSVNFEIGTTCEYMFSCDSSGVLYDEHYYGRIVNAILQQPFYSIQGIDLFESFILVLYKGRNQQLNFYAHIYLVDLFFLKENNL